MEDSPTPYAQHALPHPHALQPSSDTAAGGNALLPPPDPKALADALMDQDIAGVAVINSDGHFSYMNACFERIAGRTARELIGQPLLNVVPEDIREEIGQQLSRQLSGGDKVVRLLSRIKTNAGEIRHIQIHAAQSSIEGRPCSVAIVLDVSDAVHRERAIAERDLRLDRILRIARVATVAIDLRTGKSDWSDEMYRLLGAAPKAFAPSIESFLAHVHPDDLSEIKRHLGEAMRGAPVEPLEFRFVLPGGEIRWVYRQAELLKDELGSPTMFVATLLDISTAKEAEKRRREAEEALWQTQKMDALGHLTGGMAHDFNNLLAVVTMNAEMLGETLPSSGRERKYVHSILSASRQGAELIRSLLAFARRQPLTSKVTDFVPLLTSTEHLLSSVLGKDVELAVVTAPDLWPALIDPVQMEAALINLAVNARDAMPGGGRLVFDARNATFGDEEEASAHGLPCGDYLAISVTDTGTGMPPDVIARAFDPFFTTKGVKGTGLGLSMVHGFVKQSGGNIGIHSEPGKGTTVQMYLPRAAGAAALLSAAPASDLPTAQGERILVVDDNRALLDVTALTLKDLGYQLSVAIDAASALELLGSGEAFDLLFTDINMPGGMDGRALAETARKVQPDLRVLFTSGFLASENSALNADVARHLLSKPYEKADLAQAIRAALKD